MFLDGIQNFINDFHLFGWGICFLVAAVVIRFYFKDIFGQWKGGKLSKDELVRIEKYLSKLEDILDSRRTDKLLLEQKRFKEVLTTLNKASERITDREIRPKLTKIQNQAKKCKRRIEEQMAIKI